MEKIAEAINKVINDALGINAIELIMNLVATIILIIVVRFFFWNKITAFLEKRRNYINSEIDDAKKKNEEAAETKELAEAELKNIRLEATKIIDQAKESGQVEADRIVSEANIKAETIISEGLDKIEKEKKVAMDSLKTEVVNVASLLAEKIINEEIDEDKYNADVLKKLGE